MNQYHVYICTEVNSTSSLPKCKNDIKFDQICRTKYQHLEYQLNTIRFLVMYIFIRYTFGMVDVDNFPKKTWSKLISFDFSKILYGTFNSLSLCAPLNQRSQHGPMF
jgi:hypothetical protein